VFRETHKGRQKNGFCRLEKEFVSGSKSLLSLGEGESTYIAHLLEEQAKREGNRNNIHAVDAEFSPALPAIRKFPNNYHQVFFQNMNLKDEQGRKKYFDEIYSSYSLDFVMDRLSEVEQKQLLEKIVGMLKPNGILRVWPLSKSYVWQSLANDLKAQNLVRDYSIVSTQEASHGFLRRQGVDGKQSFLILQKN